MAPVMVPAMAPVMVPAMAPVMELVMARGMESMVTVLRTKTKVLKIDLPILERNLISN